MPINSPEIPLKMGGDHTISWYTLMQTYVGPSVNNDHWRPREGWTITKKNSFLDILLVFTHLIYCWRQRGKWEPLVCMIVRFLLIFLLSFSPHHPEFPSMQYRVGVVLSVLCSRSPTYWTYKGRKWYKIDACFYYVRIQIITLYYSVHVLACPSTSWSNRVRYWTASSVCRIIFCKPCNMLFTGCFFTVALFWGQLATMCVVIDHREKWKLKRSLSLPAPQFLSGWVPYCDLTNG